MSGFRGVARVLVRGLAYLWASPNTLLAMPAVLVVLAQRGHVRVVDGVIEAAGGGVTRVLHSRKWYCGGMGVNAVTFGHVVLGLTPAALEWTRKHERVHVAQYERWGPAFLPMYGLFSFVAWWKGLDPYRGNRFEVEAYAVDDPSERRRAAR